MHRMEQVGECFDLKDGRWTLMDVQSLWNVKKCWLDRRIDWSFEFTMDSTRIETKALAEAVAAAHAALNI